MAKVWVSELFNPVQEDEITTIWSLMSFLTNKEPNVFLNKNDFPRFTLYVLIVLNILIGQSEHHDFNWNNATLVAKLVIGLKISRPYFFPTNKRHKKGSAKFTTRCGIFFALNSDKFVALPFLAALRQSKIIFGNKVLQLFIISNLCNYNKRYTKTSIIQNVTALSFAFRDFFLLQVEKKWTPTLSILNLKISVSLFCARVDAKSFNFQVFPCHVVTKKCTKGRAVMSLFDKVAHLTREL